MNQVVDDVRLLRFYQSYPQECSYLGGRQAEMVVVDPHVNVNQRQYSSLIDIGFRRSGNSFYRPNCGSCWECKSVRIPVQDFQPSRSQKRCVRLNCDLTVSLRPVAFDDAHVDLYHRYQVWKHDPALQLKDAALHMDFLTSRALLTELVEFRLDDQLVAVCAVDSLDRGVSAVYTYFCPEQAKRGLGNFAVLWLVDYCRRVGLSYVYLGYWIRSCKKMSYKAQYQPLDVLEGGVWSRYGDF